MSFARILLAVTGVIFAVHGLVCFIQPETITLESGLAIPSIGALTEVRAEYGGLPMALGLYFIASATRVSMLRSGLMMLVTVVSGYALSRATGLAIAGEADLYNVVATAYESVTALLGIAAFSRLPKH